MHSCQGESLAATASNSFNAKVRNDGFLLQMVNNTNIVNPIPISRSRRVGRDHMPSLLPAMFTAYVHTSYHTHRALDSIRELWVNKNSMDPLAASIISSSGGREIKISESSCFGALSVFDAMSVRHGLSFCCVDALLD